MAIESFEFITVQSEFVSADLIVWRRYRVQAPRIMEQMLDLNPHVAKLHRISPFLPVGTQLRIPIDPDILAGTPQPKESIILWGSRPPR